MKLKLGSSGRVSALVAVAIVLVMVAVSFSAILIDTRDSSGGIAAPTNTVRYYNYDGSTFGAAPQVGQIGEKVEVLFNYIPQNSGKVFLGWADHPGGTINDVIFSVLDSFESRFTTMPKEGIKLYAVVAPVGYWIGNSTFNFAGAGIGATESMNAGNTDQIRISYDVANSRYQIQRFASPTAVTPLETEYTSGNIIQLQNTFSNASATTLGFGVRIDSTNPNGAPLYVLLDQFSSKSVYNQYAAASYFDNVINVNGNSKAVLQYIGTNSVQVYQPDSAVIRVANSNGDVYGGTPGIATLYLMGQGNSTLNVDGGVRTAANAPAAPDHQNGAGIGGNGGGRTGNQTATNALNSIRGETGGNIHVESGNLSIYITNNDSEHAPAIGGGGTNAATIPGDGGNINIRGGNLTIRTYCSGVSVSGAAIGGGAPNDTVKAGGGGNITISGGNISITQTAGTYVEGAGIGGAGAYAGSTTGDSGIIKITGGKITVVQNASSFIGGAAIGAGGGATGTTSPGSAGSSAADNNNYIYIGGTAEISLSTFSTANIYAASIGGGGAPAGGRGGDAKVIIEGGNIYINNSTTTTSNILGTCIGGGGSSTAASTTSRTGGNAFVTINGGNLHLIMTTTTTGDFAPAIGGGSYNSGLGGTGTSSSTALKGIGDVTINGGTITIERLRNTVGTTTSQYTASDFVDIGDGNTLYNLTTPQGSAIKVNGGTIYTSGGLAKIDSGFPVSPPTSAVKTYNVYGFASRPLPKAVDSAGNNLYLTVVPLNDDQSKADTVNSVYVEPEIGPYAGEYVNFNIDSKHAASLINLRDTSPANNINTNLINIGGAAGSIRISGFLTTGAAWTQTNSTANSSTNYVVPTNFDYTRPLTVTVTPTSGVLGAVSVGGTTYADGVGTGFTMAFMITPALEVSPIQAIFSVNPIDTRVNDFIYLYLPQSQKGFLLDSYDLNDPEAGLGDPLKSTKISVETNDIGYIKFFYSYGGNGTSITGGVPTIVANRINDPMVPLGDKDPITGYGEYYRIMYMLGNEIVFGKDVVHWPTGNVSVNFNQTFKPIRTTGGYSAPYNVRYVYMMGKDGDWVFWPDTITANNFSYSISSYNSVVNSTPQTPPAAAEITETTGKFQMNVALTGKLIIALDNGITVELNDPLIGNASYPGHNVNAKATYLLLDKNITDDDITVSTALIKPKGWSATIGKLTLLGWTDSNGVWYDLGATFTSDVPAKVYAAWGAAPESVTITQQPANTTIDNKSNAVFTVKASSTTGTLTYKWQQWVSGSWTDITGGGAYGANTSMLMVSPSVYKTGDTFRCVVSNGTLTENSQYAVLTVSGVAGTPPAIPPAPVNSTIQIITSPDSAVRMPGSNVTFSVTASCTATILYQWQVSTDGGATWQPISGATSSAYTLASVSLADNGKKYRCTLTTAGSFVVFGTAPASLTVLNNSPDRLYTMTLDVALATTDTGTGGFIHPNNPQTIVNNVTATASDSSFNVVSGTDRTFTITPRFGFGFVELTDNGTKVDVVMNTDGSATYTLTGIAANHNLVAKFAPGYYVFLTIVGNAYGDVQYKISTEAAPVTVTSSTEIFVSFGSSITLTQKVASDGVFVSWTGDTTAGAKNSAADSITLTPMLDNSNIYQTVTFGTSATTWQLTLDPGTGGTATVTYGGATFDYPGKTMNIPNGVAPVINLTSAAPTGTAFTMWQGVPPTAENYVTREFTTNLGGATASNIDRSFKAIFAANTVTLTIVAPVNGTIGLEVGGSAITTIPYGTPFNVVKAQPLKLTATPAGGYAFQNWLSAQSVGNSGNNPWNFSINENTTIDSKFVLITEVNKLTLTATTGGSITYSYTDPATTRTITSSVTAGISPMVINVPKNTSVRLTAVADDASNSFLYWLWENNKTPTKDTGGGVAESFSVPMDYNYDATAYFALGVNTETLTVNAEGGPGFIEIWIGGDHFKFVETLTGSLQTNSIGLVKGSTVQLIPTATRPAPNQNHFTGWFGDLESFGTPGSPPNYTLDVLMSRSYTVTGLFTNGDDDKSLKLSTTGAGTITLKYGTYTRTGIENAGPIYFSKDSALTLTAVPLGAGEFLRWDITLNGGFPPAVSTTTPLPVTMGGNYDIVGNFSSDPVRIVNIKVPNGDGQVQIYKKGAAEATFTLIRTILSGDSGVYVFAAYDGDVIRLVPDSNFSFWSGYQTGNNSPLEFALSAPGPSVYIDAYFATPGYDLTIGLNGTGSVNITLNGLPGSTFTITSTKTMKLAAGTTVALQAVKTSGPDFSYWTGTAINARPALVPTNASISFSTTNAAQAVTANFVEGANLTVGTNGSGTVSVSVDGTTIYTGAGPKTISFETGKTGVGVSAAVATGGLNFSRWQATPLPTGFKIFDNASQTITMSGNYNLTAYFTTTSNERTLALDFGGTGTGTITVGVGGSTQTFAKTEAPVTLRLINGDSVSLTATETAPSKFSYWDVAASTPALQASFNNLVSTAQTITMSGSYSLKAVFAGTGYTTLTLAASVPAPATGSIDVTVGGRTVNVTSFTGYFNTTDIVRITPVRAAPSQFSYWSAPALPPAPFDPISPLQQSVTMSSSYTLTANFTNNTPRELKVLLANDGMGTVEVRMGGSRITTITASMTSPMYFSNTAAIQLVATATAPNTFSFWSGTTEGISPTLNVSMSSNQTITAVFAGASSYLLKVTAQGPGYVTANIGGYTLRISDFATTGSIRVTANTPITMTAVANAGAFFSQWYNYPAGTTDTANPMIFNINANAETIIAQFVGDTAHTLTINIINQGEVRYRTSSDGGTTWSPWTTFTCTGAGPVSFARSVDDTNRVQLEATATASPANAFSFWGGTDLPFTQTLSDGKSPNPLVTFTMTKPQSIDAVFTEGAYKTLTLDIVPPGGGQIKVSGIYGSYSFTYTYGTMNVAKLDPSTNVTVEALPTTGGKFSYWSGTDKPTDFRIGIIKQTFQMNDDYDLTAHFADAGYMTLTLDTSGVGSITLEIGLERHIINSTDTDRPYVGYFNSSQSVSLTATPTAPRLFSYWLITGATPASTPAFDILSGAKQTFAMSSDYTLTAKFTDLTPWTLTLAATGNGSATVKFGDGSYTVASGASKAIYLSDGDKAILTATEAGADKFSYWSVTGTTPDLFNISRQTAQTVTMKDNYNLNAIFTTGANYWTLNLAVAGGSGKIVVSPGGAGTFEVTSTYTGYFARDSNVGLNAVATGTSPVNAFSYWSSAAMPAAPFDFLTANQTLSLKNNYSLTANFTAGAFYALTIGLAGGSGSVGIRFGSDTIGTVASPTTTKTMNVASGTSVTLTATATGSSPVNAFSFWSGTPAPTNSSLSALTFNMTATRSATAVFTDGINDRELKLNVNNAAYGTVAGVLTIGGTDYSMSFTSLPAAPAAYTVKVSNGTPVRLTGTPNGGYVFSYWNGTLTTATAAISFTMTKNYDETAYFATNTAKALKVFFDDTRGQVSLVATPLGSPTSNPILVQSDVPIFLETGAEYTLTGIPILTSPANHFSLWEDTSTDALTTIKNPVTGWLNYSQNFHAYFTDGTNDKKLSLDRAGPGSIRLTVGPAGIGKTVGPFTVTTGTPIAEETWFSAGTDITVQPMATYRFSYWSGTSVPTGFVMASSSAQSFTMQADYDLKAHFASDKWWTLTVKVDDISAVGEVDVYVDGFYVGKATSALYFFTEVDDGASVRLEAKDGATSKFSYWYWDGGVQPPEVTNNANRNQTFSMTKDYDPIAKYTGPTYWTLNVSAVDPTTASDGSVGVTVGGTKIADVRSSMTGWSMPISTSLSANLLAKDGTTSVFTYWTGGTLTSGRYSETVSGGADDVKTVIGNFMAKANTYELTITANIGGTVSYSHGTCSATVGVTGAAAATEKINVPFGTPVTVTANAMTISGTPYGFLGWQGVIVTATSPGTIPAQSTTTARSVTAVFEPKANTYDLTITANLGGTVTYSEGGFSETIGDGTATASKTITVKFGTPVTVTATPLTISGTEYAFIGWTGGTLTSGDKVETIPAQTTITARTVIANFDAKPNTYELTINTTSGGYVTYEYEIIGGVIKGDVGDGSASESLTMSIPKTVPLVTLKATEVGSKVFYRWSGDRTGSSLTDSFTMASDMTVNAIFGFKIVEPYSYYITATCDGGSTISPDGVIVLKRGDSQTFYFADKPGSMIVEVIIDGLRKLTLEEIEMFQYTFTDIMANHTIEVKSQLGSRTGPSLRVDVIGGGGGAEYSINGGPWTKYTTVVNLEKGASISVRAVPAAGNQFDYWETPARSESQTLTFNDVRGPISLKLHFAVGAEIAPPSKLAWWIIAIAILLVVAAALTWFILFNRKWVYDIVKVNSVIGEDTVRRKKAYTFGVAGGGNVAYRIGENGEWKSLSPDVDGEYTIPKGEITDSVTIEKR